MTSSADTPCAWFTTLRADGSPHTTSVWFVLVQNAFWIASAATNVKVRNVTADDRVSLAIDGSAPDPHVAQGRALVHREIAEFADVVSLFAQKYNGWNVLDETVDGPRVLLQISVKRWLLGGS
ncbi:pyridoxamine 5'-phosphate oxidase family protein [Agreia bicolorata]|uniref:Pyridoxamine 5-phosphate oxidase n=1 Tax=Agreia bicolorata TaxID=110935 RepID=A0ABR5CG53_9MICO|nr:pyridoxamine 5'-phosphate oxidase family protein [Agreia bicolorata]KJC64566.1 pyridoxamine 5-phosphate oxidase [Agreia bicolorata]